jgi:hypothetical protein
MSKDQMLSTLQRKILRRLHGPIQYKGRCCLIWNIETYNLYQDLNIVDDIKIRRIG